MTVLEGALVRLRPATRGDVSDLAEIRRHDNLLMDLLGDEFIEWR